MKDLPHLPRVEASGIHRTHLERIISLIPLSYFWAWAVVGAVLFLISVYILLFIERSGAFISVFLVLSILVAWQGAGVTWAHRRITSFEDNLKEIVDMPRDEVARRYKSQIAIIFNDRGMAVSGLLLLGIVHITGIDYHEFSFQSIYTSAFANVFYYLTVYILGAGLYVMIMTAWGVHRIGRIPLHVNALFSKSIRSLGVLYSKFTIMASAVYILWGVFHMLVPPKFSSLQLMIWFASFAALLTAYFIVPQYSIHQMMVKTKKEKIETFSSKLRKVAFETFRNPMQENVSMLRSLLDIQHQLDEMSDWPFSFYEILHITLIIIVPVSVVAMEALLGVIK